jgi:hypothetical protein
MPQAIDAALESANCFALQGKINEAMELILSVMEHPSITSAAKQRAGELKSMLEKKVALRDIEKVVKVELMETVLARFSS